MNINQNRLLQLSLIFFLLIVLVVPLLISASPSINPIPERDSGVFLYIGKAILAGQIPYRDVWDHKSPLIYYINALGLLFIHESYWGTWILEVLSLSMSAVLGFILLKSHFGASGAFLGSVFWILALGNVFDMGNNVEEYGILLQWLQLFFFLRSYSQRRRLNLFLAGIFSGFSFLLRPNMIGPFATVLSVLVLGFFSDPKEIVRFLKCMVSFVGGGIVVYLLIYSYFVLQGAGGQFLSAVYQYNLFYSLTALNRWDTFRYAVSHLSPFAQIGFLSWFLLAVRFLFVRWRVEEKILLFALLWLPIEIFLSILSGKGYLHYFISWLPPLGVIVGHISYRILAVINSGRLILLRRYSMTMIYASLAVVCFLSLYSRVDDIHVFLSDVISPDGVFRSYNYRAPEWKNVEYILNTSLPGQKVFFWGNEVMYNFAMNRNAPSPYIYLFPLITPGYTQPAMAEKFIGTLEVDKPIIVETPTVPGILSSFWNNMSSGKIITGFIRENYKITAVINSKKWVVWKYKER